MADRLRTTRDTGRPGFPGHSAGTHRILALGRPGDSVRYSPFVWNTSR